MVASRAGLGELIRERVLLISGLLAYAVLGYYWIGSREIDPGLIWTPHTRVDDWVPFMPSMMWVYAWVYTAMFYPAFVVGPRSLFHRVSLAYLAALTINLVCFLVFPASAVTLRPDVAVLDQLDMSWFHNWGLRLNYALDTPHNLFPSMHMSSATLAALCAWRARPLLGYVAGSVAVLIGFSICAVRQHYALDGVAGVALGATCYLAFVHRWRPQPDEDGPRALSWRGPVAYLAFHASVFAGIYGLYLADFRPWER